MTAKSDSKPYGLIYCITNLVSAAHAGKVLTQDHRAKLSEAKQALFADPVKRAAHLAKRRATIAAKKAAQI